jgi:hypothetical protein
MKRQTAFLLAFMLSCQALLAGGPQMHLVPNPAKNQVRVELHEVNLDDISVELYSVLGVRVADFQLQKDRFGNYIDLRFPNLPEGVYLLRVKNKDFDQTKRLKIQRN